MNHSIKPGVIPPLPGLEKEEPELADEEDIPATTTGADEGLATNRFATWNASDPMTARPRRRTRRPSRPSPVNPEPEHEHLDPEKDGVEEPEPGKRIHPTQ
jgi:hypothetical protein